MGKDGELLCRHKEGSFYSGCGGRGGPSLPDSETRAKRKFIRQIKKIDSKNEVDTFTRVALLANVEGQKYTFGNNGFTNRKEQGEYIFLSGFSKGVKQGSSFFEVNVDEGKFYITPILTGEKVWLNDAQLSEKAELKFGDHLHLENKRTPLLFQERELRPEKFLCSDAAKRKEETSKTKKLKREPVFKGEFSPGHNGLILSRILSHLPLSDIKNCRLVAKLWNEEGIKILRKEGTLSLDFRCDNDHVTQSMKLFQYALEMEDNLPLHNWIIELPPFSSKKDKYRTECMAKGMPGAKLLSDLDFYIFKGRISSASINSLELGGDICSRFDYEILLKILRTLSKTLKELKLAGKWRIGMEETGQKITFPQDLAFPALQIFTLHMNASEGPYIVQDCSNMTWFRNLVLAISHVTSLRIKSQEQTAEPFLKYLCQNSTSLSNLQDIKVLFATAPMVTGLLKLDNCLKKFELWNCHNMKIQESPLITELLSKHANSLEKLVMNFPNESWEENWKTPVVINFPAMHRLEILSLGFWDKTGHLKLNFPDGIINYGKDFPCLKSLKLQPREEKCYKSVYEMFFPVLNKNPSDTVEDEELCTSLQILELDPINFTVYDERLRKGSKNVPIFTPTEIFNIATMFPNVSNGDWIEARKSPVVEEIKEQGLGPRKLRPRSVGGAHQLKRDKKSN